MTTADDLKAWRTSSGLSQKRAAELIGVKESTYASQERGANKVSATVDAAFLRLTGESAGGADLGGSDTDPLIDATRDLPPIGIEPGDVPDDKPAVRQLGAFESLEGELLRLLVGADYLYEDFAGGKRVMKTGHIIGLADALDGIGWEGDAALIRALAPELAHGYVEWARHNKRVLGILRMLTAGGAAKAAIIPTVQLVYGLLTLHGLLPSPQEMFAAMQGGGDRGSTQEPHPEAGS